MRLVSEDVAKTRTIRVKFVVVSTDPNPSTGASWYQGTDAPFKQYANLPGVLIGRAGSPKKPFRPGQAVVFHVQLSDGRVVNNVPNRLLSDRV